MTDLRTHWMRTVHEALCGLSAKRLMLGERIIGGECATADVTCHGCRAVLRLAAMDAASGGPDDLRTLAQAVVDAPSWATVDAMRAVLLIDAAPRDTIASGLAQARAILAALDAADAQGYAQAMGEVVERCEAGMSHHGGYLSPRSRGLYHAFEDVADWARERLPAAAERD